IEAVDPSDLPAVWQALLSLLSAHGAALHSLLSHGRLAGIEDGRAVIRYERPEHETFVKLLERNGKKDIVRDALSKVLRQSVGVKFEFDLVSDATPAASSPPAAA